MTRMHYWSPHYNTLTYFLDNKNGIQNRFSSSLRRFLGYENKDFGLGAMHTG